MQSPDENQHIARAYLLGQGGWSLHAATGKMSGGMIDAGLEEYIRLNMLLAVKPEFKLTKSEKTYIHQITWQGSCSKQYFEMPGTGYYFPLVYLPHALGLRVSEALDLSIHHSYQLTRLLVLGTSMGLILWAFSIFNPGPGVLAMLLLPMTLFQMVLPTLDGFTTALSLMVVALFSRGFQNASGAASTILSSALASICLLLVVTSRIHLLPMLLIPFVSSWQRRQSSDAAWGAAVTVITAAWMIFALTQTVDTRIPRAHTTTELLKHYGSAPWDFFTVLAKTISNTDVRDFYWRSFIGILGWLDAPLLKNHYTWIGGGLLLCMLSTISIPHSMNDITFRSTMLIISTASTLLIFFALLVTWTPHPAEIIAGVQGRYFIIPAILFCLTLQGLDRADYSTRNSVLLATKKIFPAIFYMRRLLVISFGIFCLFTLISGLSVRY